MPKRKNPGAEHQFQLIEVEESKENNCFHCWCKNSTNTIKPHPTWIRVQFDLFWKSTIIAVAGGVNQCDLISYEYTFEYSNWIFHLETYHIKRCNDFCRIVGLSLSLHISVFLPFKEHRNHWKNIFFMPASHMLIYVHNVTLQKNLRPRTGALALEKIQLSWLVVYFTIELFIPMWGRERESEKGGERITD